MRKKIVAIIEKGNTEGYSIYAANDLPLFADGLTEQEARDEFLALVPEQAEYMKEKTGQYPDWYDGEFNVEFRYDMTAFFENFPFLNITNFAKSVGINPALMRKYRSGMAKASEKQKTIIQLGFDDMVSRLNLVRF